MVRQSGVSVINLMVSTGLGSAYGQHAVNFFYLVGVSVSAAAAAKSLQSCPTLCDPIDGSPPGSPVPGILQAKILGWVAISFSKA